MLSLADARMRYDHTYIQLKDKNNNNIIPVYVEQVFEEGSERKIRAINVEAQTEEFSLREYEILPRIDRRCFNSNGVVKVFEWFPGRQQKRGISRENSVIKEPIHIFIDMCELPENIMPYKAGRKAKDYYNLLDERPYPTLQEAVERLNYGEEISICLSKEFWISLSGDDGVYFIWHFFTPIALWGNDGLNILVQDYKQEVYDFFLRRGYGY